MDVKLLLAAACTLFTLRQHSTTTETQPWSSGFFSREQTSLRRLDGYGGARGLASHKICKAACESALQRHLHDWTRGANAAARQPRRADCPHAARPRRAAAPLSVRREPEHSATSPDCRGSHRRAAKRSLSQPSGRRGFHPPPPPREEGWAPARPPRPAPVSIRSTTC